MIKKMIVIGIIAGSLLFAMTFAFNVDKKSMDDKEKAAVDFEWSQLMDEMGRSFKDYTNKTKEFILEMRKR